MNNFTLPRTRLLLLLILLTALTAGGLAFGLRQSQAQSAQPTVAAPAIYAEARVNVGSLNLRTGPHVSYTAVAYLMDGERVRLVGRNRAGTSFWTNSRVGTSTLPPMWPHFLADES